MKKILISIISILSAFCLTFGIAGCGGNPTLDEEKALEIRTAFYNEHKDSYKEFDHVTIYAFYGEYNGSYVVDIFRSMETMLYTETIDGFTFTYPTPNPLLVYIDGKFYRLQEAFDAGLLTHRNLQKVWNLYGENNPNLYESAIPDLIR